MRYTLTTNIDTIKVTGVGANEIVGGLQTDAVAGGSTWNTGDSITGNGLTTISLTANGNPAGVASIVTVNNVDEVNVNLVKTAEVNAVDFTDVGAIWLSSGISGQALTVSNASTSTAYGISVNKGVTYNVGYTNVDGTADKATLAANGAGTKTSTSTREFDEDAITYANFAVGNSIESIALSAEGTNYVSINGGTGTKSITVTGSGTNAIRVAAANDTLTLDASATTGANRFFLADGVLSSTDVIKGGSGADTLAAALTLGGQMIPTITGVESIGLNFKASATFNAKNVEGMEKLTIQNSGTNASLTNLADTLTTVQIGEASALSGGTVSLGYATGAASDVTVTLGATPYTGSTTPAVSIGALTVSGNSGELTVNSKGAANNTVAGVTANSATALSLVGDTRTLTISGASNATKAQSVTFDATLKDVSASGQTLTVSDAIQTIDVTSGAGAANSGSIKVTPAASKALDLTVNVTSSATKNATVGDLTVDAGSGTASTNALTVNAESTAGSGSTGAVSINSIVYSNGSATSGNTLDVNLTAAAGNVTLATLNINGGVNSSNITVSAASSQTAQITALTGGTDADENLTTITASGAGDINLFTGTKTGSVYGNTFVDSRTATGNFTLDLSSAAATNDVVVYLGNAATLKTNTVTTGAGDDVVVGGTGTDVIAGGAGADSLNGGTGTNT